MSAADTDTVTVQMGPDVPAFEASLKAAFKFATGRQAYVNLEACKQTALAQSEAAQDVFGYTRWISEAKNRSCGAQALRHFNKLHAKIGKLELVVSSG